MMGSQEPAPELPKWEHPHKILVSNSLMHCGSQTNILPLGAHELSMCDSSGQAKGWLCCAWQNDIQKRDGYGRIPEERKKHCRKPAAFYDDTCLPTHSAPLNPKPSVARRESLLIKPLSGGTLSATGTRAAVGSTPAGASQPHPSVRWSVRVRVQVSDGEAQHNAISGLPVFLGKTVPSTQHALAANALDSVKLAAQARERASYSATQVGGAMTVIHCTTCAFTRSLFVRACHGLPFAFKIISSSRV